MANHGSLLNTAKRFQYDYSAFHEWKAEEMKLYSSNDVKNIHWETNDDLVDSCMNCSYGGRREFILEMNDNMWVYGFYWGGCMSYPSDFEEGRLLVAPSEEHLVNHCLTDIQRARYLCKNNEEKLYDITKKHLGKQKEERRIAYLAEHPPPPPPRQGTGKKYNLKKWKENMFDYH